MDDDTALINSLRTTLENDGHFVTAAEGGQAGIDAFQSAQRDAVPFEVVITGEAAAEACAAWRFDLVLMDLHMPGLDGIDATLRIRKAEAETNAKPVPIIGLQHPLSMYDAFAGGSQ